MEQRKLRKKKEKAIHDGNYEQLYVYCKELGDEYLKLDNYEEALTEYKEAEFAAKKLNNKFYIAIANRMIGETLCFLGEFEEAIAHQKMHLNFSKEEDNLIEEQRALATLGRTYFVKAESFLNDENENKNQCLQLSRKYYLKSLHICDRLSVSSDLTQKQLSEMKSRLYLNLGLTLESQGDPESGIEHVAKAINICKHLELTEDLCRCYIAQGSLYSRQGNTSNAVLNYDEALKISKRMENHTLFSCEILSLKADVLVELLDFTGAKQVLIEAYKLKTPDLKERKEIERKLKILVMVCRSENELLETSETDYNARKRLNETLGDCFVKLKRFEKAIECYSKMLKCSKAMGLTGKELISAYFSLSQTYKDVGRYDEALEYFQLEFDIEKDNAVEACKTLLNIIEILELRKENFEIIMEKYQQALSLAKKVGDFKTEATVLKNMIATQKEYHQDDLAYETQKELDLILCCISNEDSEIVASSSDEDIEFDIDLEELSDLNVNIEDDTSGREKHPRRKSTKSFLIRKNEKGETPLHVASAKGNIQLINSLLKQGHPVNVQDAAGWSPLHEACNHGQVEAAKILIDSGANIDDRGGPQCDGITPLHDAAACGHLEVMDMLLDNGASPLARTNQGETALDCLLACKHRVESEQGELDDITLAHFNSVVSRLQECLDKAGYAGKKVVVNSPSVGTLLDNRLQTQRTESRISQKLTKNIETSRKRCNPETLDDTFGNAATEYQNAIQALRRRNKSECSTLSEKPEKPKTPALLNTEEVGDDWLENDVETSKRPVKRRCEQFVGQSSRSKLSLSTQKKKSSTSTIPRWDDAFDDLNLDELERVSSPSAASSRLNTESFNDEIFAENASHRPVSPHSVNSNQRARPKYQKSLLSVGFQRFDPPNHSTQQSESPINARESDYSEPSPATGALPISSTSLSIKVRIEGKLFLVPVPSNSIDLNIKWLMSEACRRYQNLEGVSPILSLSTEDGAILDENDPIAIVYGKNEIHATVMSWNLAPLVDRYKEACASSNMDMDEFIRLQLDICQANACLEIKHVPVSLSTLSPALRAISYYQNLQRICLRGVYLGDSGFKQVVDSITKLTQIRSVDLASNNITNEGLSYFTMILSKHTPLQNLEELDFSYNPLGEDSVNQLTNISRYMIRLRIFILKYVGLTSQCLYEAPNLSLEFVEHLDISGNRIDREGIGKFLSALDSNKIKHLNVSRTGSSQVFRECLLFLDRGYLDALESLKLADLNVDDDDVEQLIQSLQKADQLACLDLSCNQKITYNSHIFLSRLNNLKELNLSGCGLLAASNKLILPFHALTLSGECNESNFKNAPYCLISTQGIY